MAPAGPLRAGVLLFALAQIIVGSAGGIGMIVAGRLLSGVAEGLLDVGLMVLIARILPEELRVRMLSLFPAAWVLPSVPGPFVTGTITEWVGWRWVFLGALTVLIPTWLLIQPALRKQQAGRLPAGPVEPSGLSPTSAAITVVAFLAATAVGAVGLLPSGTFRLRRGISTIVAMHGFTGIAFAGTGTWLPLCSRSSTGSSRHPPASA